jgi:hypothetical protein
MRGAPEVTPRDQFGEKMFDPLPGLAPVSGKTRKSSRLRQLKGIARYAPTFK